MLAISLLIHLLVVIHENRAQPPPLAAALAEGGLFRAEDDVLKIVKQLGRGSYGVVFMCESSKLKKQVALKIELPSAQTDAVFKGPVPQFYTLIEHEYAMLTRMERMGYPHVHYHSFSGPYRYLVMDLMGETVWALLKRNPEKRLYTFQVIHIAVQLLYCLEAIHGAGYIVYDIHPGNMMLRKIGRRFVFGLIDPGMMYAFMIDGVHIEPGISPVPDNKKNPTWTCLIDDAGQIGSRACELERAFNTLLQLHLGKLPWEYLFDQGVDVVRQFKRQATVDVIFRDPRTAYMKEGYIYIRSLGFKDTPDYKFLRNVFRKQLLNLHPIPQKPLKRKLSHAGSLPSTLAGG